MIQGADRSGSGTPRPCVLVVDDEPDIRELIELTLVKMGLDVVAAGTLQEAKSCLQNGTFHLCLTDMRLQDGDGLDLVRHIAGHHASLPVAVITAHGNTENAVAALKSGAFDYVAKPVALEQLRALVRAALSLPAEAGPVAAVPGRQLLGDGPALTLAREMIGKLARTQAPAHISGESGSGKELAARLIHQNGARRHKPFVAVNCGAIPDSLMESEFFGYRKGAFTGADKDRDGFFQAADGGTLFLDEVAELPLAMQVKLLRAIQEKRVRKIGAIQEEPVDVRIISATHQSLERCVETGVFRADLYYRLNVIDLKMPALRDCREDIPLIARNVLARLAAAQGVAPARLSDAALAGLSQYDFPGNTRELENILERAMALSGSHEIQPGDLRLRATSDVAAPGVAGNSGAEVLGTPLPDYLDRIERDAIEQALVRCGNNRTAAARLLGITFRQLRYRIQRLGIADAVSPVAGDKG